VPSPAVWAEGPSRASIAALRTLEGGTLTSRRRLLTARGLSRDAVNPHSDRVVGGNWKTPLPPVFSLHSILPDACRIDGTGPATMLLPEFRLDHLARRPWWQCAGAVAMDQAAPNAGQPSYALIPLFGTDQVYCATRLPDPQPVPDGWPVRVLAGLHGA